VWQRAGGEDAEYPPIAVGSRSASRGQGAAEEEIFLKKEILRKRVKSLKS